MVRLFVFLFSASSRMICESLAKRPLPNYCACTDGSYQEYVEHTRFLCLRRRSITVRRVRNPYQLSDRRGTSFRVDTLPIGFPVLLLLRAIGRHSKYRCISPYLEDASLQASTSRMHCPGVLTFQTFFVQSHNLPTHPRL